MPRHSPYAIGLKQRTTGQARAKRLWLQHQLTMLEYNSVSQLIDNMYRYTGKLRDHPQEWPDLPHRLAIYMMALREARIKLAHGLATDSANAFDAYESAVQAAERARIATSPRPLQEGEL